MARLAAFAGSTRGSGARPTACGEALSPPRAPGEALRSVAQAATDNPIAPLINARNMASNLLSSAVTSSLARRRQPPCAVFRGSTAGQSCQP
ncbi:MAG: hypothetical protein AMXMBFR56_40890 [Polyangiaceae bacterium]